MSNGGSYSGEVIHKCWDVSYSINVHILSLCAVTVHIPSSVGCHVCFSVIEEIGYHATVIVGFTTIITHITANTMVIELR